MINLKVLVSGSQAAWTCERSSTRKSGRSFSRAERSWDVHVARTRAPEALPERIPVGASSTTRAGRQRCFLGDDVVLYLICEHAEDIMDWRIGGQAGHVRLGQ